MNSRFFTLLRFAVALTVFIAAVSLTSCARKQVSDTDIACTWGDTAMTVAQFKNKMDVRFRNETDASNRPYEDRLMIINEYVLRDCKLLEGRRLGFDKREDIQKMYKDAIDMTASQLLYDDKVQKSFITEDMLRDFAEHSKVEVRAQHILIAMEPTVKGKDTLAYWNRLQEVYEKAKAGENFDRLVDRYSEDQSISRSLHGDLGYFTWGKMVEPFERAAWNLNPGEISKPVKTRYGYHIVKLLDKRPAGLEVNTSHILINASRRDAPAETLLAYERAMEILKEAKKSGADFRQLARRYSEDRRTWNTGEVGYVARGSMPSEYWDKVFTMKEGEIDGPVRSYKGYHIIKVNEIRVEPWELDDQEVRDRMYSRLSHIYDDTLRVIAENFIAQVKKDYDSKYDDKVVKLMLRKLNDKSTPENVNRFANFTAEERQLKVLNDKLGGVTIDKLVDAYGDHRFPPDYKDDPQFIRDMVDPLIQNRYLADIASKEGYYDHPKVIEDGNRSLDNAILPEIEREMVYNKGIPTEEKVQDYYRDNIKDYTEAATATIYEIMVDNEKQAQEYLDRVKKGEDISTLARRYTRRTETRSKGGRLGPFEIDKYGGLSRKAFGLKPGETAGPIKVDNMFSVLQLVELTPERVKPLDEVRSQIENDVRFKTQNEIKDAWENELRKAYNIRIDESVVRAVWPIVEDLPEEMQAERKDWKKDREERAKRVRQSPGEQIKLPLKPGSEQEYTTKEGKRVSVKIGEPRYLDKEGNPIDPEKSPIKITSKGKVKADEAKKPADEEKKKNAPKIRIVPHQEGK